MRDFYNKYWGIIASIQVPHHGSENNYEPELYKYPVRGIVSVGDKNRYHHPDIDILVKIQNDGCHPVIVTEDKSSMKIYHYEIK
jgi:beta-lactamase superfamily II metal-dependent hydrolase